jgi:hypothetical protein
MDLLRILDVAYEEGFERHPETGRFIPIRLIDDPQSCKGAVDAICDLVLRQFDNARAFLPALEWAVNETVDNMLVHAEMPVPGIVCAQYFPNRQRIDVGICDMGRGIMASLSESMHLWSHGHAITEALKRGVTRNRSEGQGNGLAGCRAIVTLNGGEFWLWTGDVTYRLQEGAERGFDQMPLVPGTGLLFSLDTTRPVNLADTFLEGGDWSFIEAEGERLAAAGGIRVSEECFHTGLRSLARGLRRKILTVLPSMDQPLVLDFEGVTGASSSFLDELLGRLVEELGADGFRDRVRIVNMADEIRARANTVIRQRL